MDALTFDTLIKRLATRRLTRVQTLRGLAVGGLTVLTRLSLPAEVASAKKPHQRKVKLCKCPTGDATSCKTDKVPKDNAKKLARRACNYKGKCQAGVTDCADCVPESHATTCAAGCGTRTNTCGQAVSCPCPTGQECYADGSCKKIAPSTFRPRP
jgi:hypothetical protein